MENKSKKMLQIGVIVATVAAIAVGGFCFFNSNSGGNDTTNQTELAEDDTSYKTITAKDTSYNGVYTLTKLDDKGNNTWDGLIMWVQNDKIQSAVLCNYLSLEDYHAVGDEFKKYNSTEEIQEAMFDDGALSNEAFKYFKSDMIQLNSGDTVEALEDKYQNPVTGFSTEHDASIINSPDNKTEIYGRARCLYYNQKVNLNVDYDNLKKMELIAGYDEKSQEIWLSKLLKNEQSIYSDGYKLIGYKDALDMSKNCQLDDGYCMKYLNEMYDAGLNFNLPG